MTEAEDNCPRCEGSDETDFNSLCSACQPIYGDALLAKQKENDG